MKAIVDREACVGCGLCETVCPEVFELDAESIAIVLVDEISMESESCALESRDDCPVEAITIE
ncbi:ferredoxin [Acetobacterium bakii]|uniref:Ferredoxin n=1 Tax=Acetobacterium bakii TaxID=52689 RepID=A0A0L6U4I8_9FIRM|nr:ferredoxin [Acetobacterium bakii]KNZ43413.1 hypothetical protein AKG39_01565 [Acetobacterium bakii]